MSREEIEALFPATVEITQEMIDSADIWNIQECIGARALRTLIPDSRNKITWGVYSGYVYHSNNKERIDVNTQGIDVMNIKEPQLLLLSLGDNWPA